MFIPLGRIKTFSFLFILFGIVLYFTFGQELTHEVTMTLKLIQVYVMDSHDRPVTDLTAEDFVVTDNKKAVKITDFERYSLGPTLMGKHPLLPREQQETAIESSTKTLNRKFFLFLTWPTTAHRDSGKHRKRPFILSIPNSNRRMRSAFSPFLSIGA